MSFAKRFIGAENLPTRLSEFDVQHSFCLSAVAALEAAHPNDLADTARMWLYERRIVIPGPRPVANLARVACNATEAELAATIEAGLGKAALLKAVDWSCAPQDRMVGCHLERLKTPPKRHSPKASSSTTAPKIASESPCWLWTPTGSRTWRWRS